MELELKKMEETVNSIHEEMFYLRERLFKNETQKSIKIIDDITLRINVLWLWQGTRDVRAKHENKLDNGFVKFGFVVSFFVSGGLAAMAFRVVFRKEEDYLILSSEHFDFWCNLLLVSNIYVCRKSYDE